MPTLFISDLHLSPTRPETYQQLAALLQGPARHAEALYVLGDLFDYWIGDDDLDESHHRSVVEQFARLSAKGVALYFMHGNRDFLLGERFVQACGGALLPEEHVLELYGTHTLLTHGDQLCTDDVSYQAFRRQVRDPQWQQTILQLPLAERKARALAFREASDLAKFEKSMAIMDVNLEAVATLLRRYGYPRLIHGHTHRPARHLHQVDGHRCERWVLADWYQQAHYLIGDADGIRTGCIQQSLPN